MKSSRFNVLREKNDRYFALNTSSSMLTELDERTYGLLRSAAPIDDPDFFRLGLCDDLMRNGFIVENGKDEILCLEKKFLSAKEDTALLTITVAPTLNCNFACHYCYENKVPLQISDSGMGQILNFIEGQFKSTNVSKLNFSWFGGEPLLCIEIIGKFSHMIAALSNKYDVETKFWVITNGYLLNGKALAALNGIPNLEVCVTIDGTRKFHDAKRKLAGGKPTFDSIMNNLLAINDKAFDLTIRVNIDRDNIEGAYELIRELHESNVGIDKIYAGHLQDYTKECDFEENKILSTEEFANVSRKFDQIAYKYNYKSNFITYTGHIDVFCRAARNNTYVFNHDLSMYICENDIGILDRSIGVCGKRSIDESRNDTNFKKYAGLNCFRFDKCINCKLLPACMGGCAFLHIKHGEPQCPAIKYSFERDVECLIEAFMDNALN